MAYESIDYDNMRERAEKRLAPMKKLRRLRLWFLLNLGLFISFLIISSYHVENSIFVKAIQQSGSFFNDLTQQTENWNYVSYETYPLVVFISVIWFLGVLVHAFHVWSAYRHERAIQREMERETNLEMERLRLQVELAKNESDTSASNKAHIPEKAKRTLRLSDDGELLSENTPRANNQRRS